MIVSTSQKDDRQFHYNRFYDKKELFIMFLIETLLVMFTYEIYDDLTLQQNRETGLGQVNVQLLVDTCRQRLNLSDILLQTYPTGGKRIVPPQKPEILNPYYLQLQSLLCHCQSNMTGIFANYPICKTSIITLCSTASLRDHFPTICDACFQQSSSNAVYSEGNYVQSTHCRGNIIRSVSLLYLRGLCRRPGVGGQAVP